MAAMFEADVPREEGGDAWQRFGTIVVAILGLGVWAQLIFPGLSSELRLAQISPLLVLTYVAPIIALAAGVYLRSVLLLLLIFPLVVLPGVAALPQPDRLFFFEPWSFLRVAANFAIYLAATAAWCTRSKVAFTTEDTEGNLDPRGVEYQRYVNARLPVLVLLFAAPAYGIFFDPAIVGTIARNFEGSEAVAQVFLSLILFFFWCVMAYTMFLVPALNLEYDRRRVEKSVDAIVASTRPQAVFIRLAMWAAVITVVLTLFVLIF